MFPAGAEQANTSAGMQAKSWLRWDTGRVNQKGPGNLSLRQSVDFSSVVGTGPRTTHASQALCHWVMLATLGYLRILLAARSIK